MLGVGQRVFWTDPNEANSCSGEGVIVEINSEDGMFTDSIDNIISIKKDDGKKVKAFVHEVISIVN